MKIFQYWTVKEVMIGKTLYHFKAGSNVSQEDAERQAEKNIAIVSGYIAGQIERTSDADYEVSICEEIVKTLDEHNIITRNRYGAQVLNSDQLLFLDIDEAPHTSFFSSIFSKDTRTDKERILDRIRETALRPDFREVGFRVYETFRGIRLLLSLPAQDVIESGKLGKIAKRFGTDPLYTTLCMKQHCCRARLTPKPARIPMKTLIKLKFPYSPDQQMTIKKWVEEYQERSKAFNVCHLLAQYGPAVMNPAIEFHDAVTGANCQLPLA